MKFRLIMTGYLLCLIPIWGNAQGGPLHREARERIEAQRVAFITQKLSLTPDEAAKFWPVYNEYKDQLKNMRDDIERTDLMNVTDAEATTIIERHFAMEDKKQDLKRNLFTRLKTAISPRKILMLHAAEREFNRELLRKANDFRRD